MVVSVGARTAGVADRSGPVALTRDLAHPDDEIAWTVYGQVTVELPGHEHTLDADHLLWLPAGTPHRMTAGPDSLLVPLWTPAGVVRPGGVPTGPTLCRVDAPLRRALAAALQARLGEQEEEAFLVTELLGLLAVRAVVGEGLPLPRADPARAVADAVLADPAVRRPMTELAAAVHVSPKTLQRSFVAQTGLSFTRWRVTAVCHRGRRLIADGQSVRATATALGYRSTSAFVQSYAGVFGTTPGAHRGSSAS